MDIDKTVYGAIKAAIKHYGNQAQFAAAAQIQRSMPNEYAHWFTTNR